MRVFAGVLLLTCSLAASVAPAQASGTARIQQPDGVVKIYPNVHVRIENRVLHLTSADGKGTLSISRAACSMIGGLMRCLPDQAQLAQFGETHSIALKNATVWLNPGTENLQLPLSSTQIPPHGIVVSLVTVAGTYVSLSGTVDEVSK